MTAQWQTLYGRILIQTKRTLPFLLGMCTPSLCTSSPAPTYSLPPIFPSTPNSGAGYTFGSGVVRKFLETNNMNHILRAHQLCMEGFSVLFDKRLSTVWSAPNYCYRCGNSASILEIGPGETSHFNVFDAAPENLHDGPGNQPPAGVPIKAGSIFFRGGVLLT